MNAPVPKDPVVTLDDLKRAIEFVPEHPGPCIPGQNVERWLALLHEYKRWALEAWRTAFEWREHWHKRGDARLPGAGNGYAEWKREGDEGLRLIREKLQS